MAGIKVLIDQRDSFPITRILLQRSTDFPPTSTTTTPTSITPTNTTTPTTTTPTTTPSRIATTFESARPRKLKEWLMHHGLKTGVLMWVGPPWNDDSAVTNKQWFPPTVPVVVWESLGLSL